MDDFFFLVHSKKYSTLDTAWYSMLMLGGRSMGIVINFRIQM
jgi:hypothetical protein